MDLLCGLGVRPDRPFGTFAGEVLRELRAVSAMATVVEEMLVALLHMQVDVCHFRRGRRLMPQLIPTFRKNIIAFPQELSEVKQLFFFLTHLSVGDVVSVVVGETVRRARVCDFTNEGFFVQFDRELTRRPVSFLQIRQRIVLPWRPVTCTVISLSCAAAMATRMNMLRFCGSVVIS